MQMKTNFELGAEACKAGWPRKTELTGLARHKWQQGYDQEHFNPSGDRPAGTVDRLLDEAPSEWRINRIFGLRYPN